jgi:hypothetical protein
LPRVAGVGEVSGAADRWRLDLRKEQCPIVRIRNRDASLTTTEANSFAAHEPPAAVAAALI